MPSCFIDSPVASDEGAPGGDRSILLVNLSPGSDATARLRVILDTAQGPPLRVFEDRPVFDEISQVRDQLTSIISRLDQRIVLPVLVTQVLGPVRDLLRLLADVPVRASVVPVVDGRDPVGLFELLNLGAADFITPPLSPGDVLPRLWRLIDPPALQRVVRNLKPRVGLQQLIGKSPNFVAEVERIPLVAGCDAAVLISGETGTGKELFSRAIHYVGARASHPFIPVNCGAIPTELAEAELFGHERGAFTGAVTSRAGLIAEAEGGTLFLDEIDCFPAAVQVKVLRFLQDKEYRPLGSGRVHRADLRIIAATNSDLRVTLEQGRLRRDLYYRLNVISLKLPALRDRQEDILLLARHFLAKYAREFRARVREISAGALQKLVVHDWPGNVRELENVIASAVVLAQQTDLSERDIMLPASRENSQAESFQEAKARTVAGFERTYLANLLVLHRGNISLAARTAGKNRRAFFELLRKHAIDARNFREG